MKAHLITNPVKVIIMVGIPASGKDTMIEELTNKAKEDKMNRQADIHFYPFSRDKIRFSLLKEGEDYFSHEGEVEKIFYFSIKNKIMELANGDAYTAAHSYIIVNATHISKASRKKLMKRIACNAKVEYYALFINTKVSTALERNRKREGLARVPDNVIYNMNTRLEVPTYEEGFKKIDIIEEEK